MGIFRRRVPSHYIRIHPDNVGKADWIILLEAGTIVGPTPEKLRVAKATLERTIARKHNIFLRRSYYLVLDGYDPRIHALYFCPQLYKFDSESKLVPLEGEEIGKMVARAVQGGVVEKRPWYSPLEKTPQQPIITASTPTEFDTLVVNEPPARHVAA
jgi:hypothetical protein